MTQIADHFPQFLIVREAVFTNKTLSYYQHDCSKFDQGKFRDDFNNLNFDYLGENQNDVNTKFNRFLANLDKIVKKISPLKKLTRNELKLRKKPWINSRIRKMMRLRDKFLKKSGKNQTQQQHFYIINSETELQLS